MVRILKLFVALLALALLALAGYYLLRPSPASGTATLPRWVATLDEARVPGASLALQPFRLESGGAFQTLKAAVAASRDGDTIIVAPGTYSRDCAVVHSGKNLTIRAAVPGTVTFERELCEGKATLVLRGGAVVVSGLRFRNLKMSDANGAGIRAEGGDIIIRDSTFEDSENGVLGNTNLSGSVSIEHSIFRRLGGCPPEKLCAHSVYIGDTGRVVIRDSLFEKGLGGHYMKLRGPRVEVRDNLIDDSGGTTTSYLIDLPNGATGAIIGNTLVKGPKAENRCCAIIMGEEGAKNPGTVEIRDNVAINLVDRPVILLADLTGEARLGANTTQGWWLRRTGLTYKTRCLGCGALR